jgi:ABC-type transport system involved in cytochrome c biogenesis, permease component
MICGAVWAQQAWGSYWTWDGKECWAAATWLFTLAATHAPATRKKLIIVLTAIAFIAMNVTWYGVNYLPSSTQSLHTYTQQ